MAIPNEYQFVVETANKYPREFREAHTGGPNTELWIRLLAWELHSKRDPRWGLNGKRGDKNVISQDCVAWKGEGVGSDAHDNLRPMTVVDVIEGAGGNNPKPRWGVFNNPQTDSAPGGATWIMPRPIPGYHDSTLPSPNPVPPVNPPADTVGLEQSVEKLSQQVGELASVITVLAQEVTALKVVTSGVDAKLNAGFVIKGKAGWPIGDVNGTVLPRVQD